MSLQGIWQNTEEFSLGPSWTIIVHLKIKSILFLTVELVQLQIQDFLHGVPNPM